MASSSSVSVFDNYRFKTAFNEELYNTIVKNKKVIAECCFDLDDDEYPEVREQIALRGWRRDGRDGKAWRTHLQELCEGCTNRLLFAQVQGATTDFEARKEHDQQLDRVLTDLGMPGATWKLSTGQQRVPIQLRRQELNPIARGGMSSQFTRSSHPLIEDIIANKMVRMAQGIKEKGKMEFPSTIYKLCKEAGVPLREFRRTKKIQDEKPITARRMESTRQEQKLLGKEILDVKKYQMSAVTMGSSSSPQKYEPDQALMKIREQHANFFETQRQLKEWTRNSSARECYLVWAHQQVNPNLVEMPVHKITKQIYYNKDNKRPLFYGLLKSDLPPSESAPPPPTSNDPQNAPK
ncbi:hypothetical protein PIB30_077346 [Stylosanthes scabra]|uniref:Uncharacterized protein n=1 Tax=Stylosanthes scabra TaxID=79078 RepID=A0ABU6SQP5_9FABA|nr:hypothetical protein [Stylosanthes scabra]